MNKKKSSKILLAVMGLLISLSLIASLFTLDRTGMLVTVPVTANIFIIITLIFVALYGFLLYKKPHSNLLKYAMLLFSVSMVINGAYFISYEIDSLYVYIVRFIASIAIAYAAGRLNRIKQNRVLFSFVDISLLICSVISLLRADTNLRIWNKIEMFYGPIILTTLMIAYFVRFEEHKEAGLEDAPKK